MNSYLIILINNIIYELGNFRSSIKILKIGLNSMIEKDLIKEMIIDISILDEMIADNNNSTRLYYKRAKILKE